MSAQQMCCYRSCPDPAVVEHKYELSGGPEKFAYCQTHAEWALSEFEDPKVVIDL